MRRYGWIMGVVLVALSACDDTPIAEEASDGAVQDAADRADHYLPTKDAGEIPPPPDAWAPPPPLDAGVDAAEAPVQVVSIETTLGSGITRAGLANRATCQALDADGFPVAGVALGLDVRPADGWARDELEPDQLTGQLAGTYLVTCHAPALGLRDGTPARWDVLPGPARRVVATADPDVITAGETSQVTCEAWDAWGNPLDATDALLQVRPEAGGIFPGDREVMITTADHYIVQCLVPGAEEQYGAPLDVLPARPARLLAAVQPVAAVYDIGQVVTFAAQVVDEYGNAVPDAPLVWSSRPPLPGFGEGRYRPAAEGRYVLRVEVEGTPLFQEAEILVDAGGPAIGCVDPPDGAMIGVGPVDLVGRVADVAGVQSVRVNGREAQVAEDGRFVLPVQSTWGLNVQSITATDAVGNENSTFCAWFASGEYVAENARVADTIQLHLSQGAVDDGAPDRPIRSLTDLLRRVINSPGLLRTIDETLRAQNPVLPTECRQRIPIVGCVFSLGAEYRGMRINGARTITSTLVDGGLRLRARINALELDVQLRGTVNNSGTISAEYVEVDLTFDVRLEGGRPVVRLRGAGQANVGRLSSDFDGVISGFLLDLVFSAFEGTIRGQVVGALQDFISGQANDLLAGFLNGIDLASLSVELQLPGFGGGPATPLSLAVDFSSLNTNPQRLLMGISTRVDGPSRQGARSAGVPMPPGDRTVVMQPRGTAAAAINLGVINQLLHRAWRAGVFTLPDAGNLLGGLGDGVSVGLRVLVPPAVRGRAGATGVELHLGPAVAEITWPDLFEAPITLRIAALAEADVALQNGTDVAFRNVHITRLYLALDGVSVTPQARLTLERELGRIIEALVGGALSAALPTLPVPDFALPDSLSVFDIPRGTRLGVRDLSLSGSASHFILDGNLRE